jgi:hypothetical protein
MMAHHAILVGIAIAFGVSLLAVWVAALSAPDGPAEPSSLDQWDNGRAHVAEQDGTCCEGARPLPSLGANCCGAEVVTTVHGWTLCESHKLAA